MAVLAEAGVRAGEQLRVEALEPGRIVLTRAEDCFEDLLGALGDDVHPPGYLSPAVARLAAELRASRGLKLPDAVILATGMRLDADVIVTADARWKGIERVLVVEGGR